MEESGAGMNLGCEEEKETCTGNRPRSHDPTPTWGNSSSVSYAAGQKKNERTLNKNARRRPPEAQARNAEMERARKKRLREGKLKEEEQRLVKQKLEAPDGDAEGPQLSGAPPGATAQEENTQPNLTRGGGYDTTNNMNRLQFSFATPNPRCVIAKHRSNENISRSVENQTLPNPTIQRKCHAQMPHHCSSLLCSTTLESKS